MENSTSNTSFIDTIKKKFDFREVVRFGLVGVFATLIQWGVYALLNKFTFNYFEPFCSKDAFISITTIISYGISFIFNFFLSNYFTFKTKPTKKNGLGFAFSHLVNCSLQAILTPLFVRLGAPQNYALLFVFPITIPINFLMVRYFLKKK